MYKLILSILAAWHGANAAFMLVAPESWYRIIPGVVETGPFNPHFVQDIGLAFLAAAAGLAIAARHVQWAIPALAAPAVFLGGHGFLHFAEWLDHGSDAATVARDTVLILIPGLAPALLLLRAMRYREASA